MWRRSGGFSFCFRSSFRSSFRSCCSRKPAAINNVDRLVAGGLRDFFWAAAGRPATGVSLDVAAGGGRRARRRRRHPIQQQQVEPCCITFGRYGCPANLNCSRPAKPALAGQSSAAAAAVAAAVSSSSVHLGFKFALATGGCAEPAGAVKDRIRPHCWQARPAKATWASSALNFGSPASRPAGQSATGCSLAAPPGPAAGELGRALRLARASA